MSDRWKWVRRALAMVITVGVARALIRHWDEIRRAEADLIVRPLPILASVLLVWAMYGLLILNWRQVVLRWSGTGTRLPRREAARIWMLSSLGRYIPGKIWTITGMAVLARDSGVAAWAATGSAILLQVISLGTGAAVVATTALVAGAVGKVPFGWTGIILLLSASVAAIAAVSTPAIPRWIGRRVTPGADVPSPGLAVVTRALVANSIAWIGYGLALWLLAQGTLAGTPLTPGQAIGAWAASYLAGFLSPAPGGIGFREGVLFAMLREPIGAGPALALTGASRLTLTLTELGAALPFLLVRASRIPHHG